MIAEVRARIEIARGAFVKMRDILASHKFSLPLGKKNNAMLCFVNVLIRVDFSRGL